MLPRTRSASEGNASLALRVGVELSCRGNRAVYRGHAATRGYTGCPGSDRGSGLRLAHQLRPEPVISRAGLPTRPVSLPRPSSQGGKDMLRLALVFLVIA